jgi:hypothetical protein
MPGKIIKMKKKLIAIGSLLIILIFIGYIVIDTLSFDKSYKEESEEANLPTPADTWNVSRVLTSDDGPLAAVTVNQEGKLFLGGDSYVTCYSSEFTKVWVCKTPQKINSITCYNDTMFAASDDMIYVMNITGRIIAEWGPYESKSIITSISASNKFVAFADAGVKRVFILDKKGEVLRMIGLSGNQFIIPSPYFDVAIFGDNTLFIANTGHRRIETWTTDGKYIESFGYAGTAPDAFCGCCNPAHFAVIPDGFITSEKGINRIKKLDPDGKFVEYISSKNAFTPSIPLDISSIDGKMIYGANPADSKLYIFTPINY